MKVLLVHKFYRKLSGAEMYFHDVVRILKANQHTVKIYTTNFNAEGGIDEKVTDSEVVYGTAVDYLRGGAISKMMRLPQIIYSDKNKEEFAALLKEFKPDVVHVFAIYVTISPSILDACREAGTPVVMSCNDYKHICTNYRLYHHGHICTDCKGNRFYKAITNNCCKHSIAFSIASSIEAYAYERKNIFRKNVSVFSFESKFMLNITKEFWGSETHRSYLLGKPFDATQYDAHPDADDYLLYIGRLSDEKGVDVLLKAMALVPEAKLRIVGTGYYIDYLKDLSVKLKVTNVTFEGSKWGDEAKDFIRRSRFVVIPSLWHENFPYVITECFALGKAIIGSNRGGIPENIISGETGYVYDADNHEQLADFIRILWREKAEAVSMGMKAKKLADEAFNDSVFHKKLMGLYDLALTEKKQSLHHSE